jgi:hypothetical protein
MANLSTESERQYVERVGTTFAIANYRGEANAVYKKINVINSSIIELRTMQETHPDFDEDDVMLAALQAQRQAYSEQIKRWQQLETDALLIDAVGTKPGKQEHLDGNGIQINLQSIARELGRSRHAD